MRVKKALVLDSLKGQEFVLILLVFNEKAKVSSNWKVHILN